MEHSLYCYFKNESHHNSFCSTDRDFKFPNNEKTSDIAPSPALLALLVQV